jgi:eukaryotic-like serine/threonine-protein kinase
MPACDVAWNDADLRVMRGPSATFSDPPIGHPGDAPVPTIGHIGRYALKHQLGEGGIGTVFAAHDPLLSRLIAVKTLHVEVDESEREAFNALFLNEARAAGGLSHPHIVTVFDAGVSDDRAYIAMELLKGRDLRQLRQEGWRATPAQAALIVRRVADALGYAHSKGVIHRDVKPANIFMTGRTQPKVLDFGIARITHHEGQHSRHEDIAAGSPYYMAPEQVRQESVDRRADVFSLGVVLYELLTNLKPFRGNTLEEITAAVLAHDPLPANAVDPDVPLALAEIATKAMAKNPEHRFRSARAFARELRHWLEDNAVSGDGDLQGDTARSRKPMWIALGALGLVVTGAVAWGLFGPARESASTAVAAPASAAAPVAAPVVAPAASSAVDLAAAALAAASAAAIDAAASASASASVGSASVGSAITPELASAAAPALAVVTPEPASAVAANRAPTIASTPIKPAVITKEPLRETAKEKRAREREARLANAATPTTAPAATGLLRIAISPWGDIEVDGKPAGSSPPLTELTLSPGRHQIVVRNTDLPPLSTSVNVTADQPVTLKHKF